MRGRWLDGLLHVCDWWATFASLAGVSGDLLFTDSKSTDSWSIPDRVKHVDSLNMWPYLSGQEQSSPRNVVHLSYDGNQGGKGGLIVGRWKLMIGRFDSLFPSPISPDPMPRRLTQSNGTS